MAKAMKMIGRIKCGCCGEVIPVKEQANGLAIATCNYCDNKLQAFGKGADSIIRQKMTPVDTVKEPEPPAVQVVVPEPPKKTGFTLF